MKKVLVLGAGLVSRPLVNYLLVKQYQVTVATRTVSKAEALVSGHSNGIAVSLNVKSETQLENLINESDIVISLLPYTFHVQVARFCIKHKKHLVTTSYVSAAMQALHDEARQAGVLLLNEIGLDPGIDHMSAMKIIDGVHAEGGRVLSFRSYCGGLPAPQSNTNPFGYKFSWSPRGVVMAGRNNGQFLQEGEVIFIPGRDLFRHYEILDIEGAGSLEGYTNRNALPYKELYGLHEAHTVFRGTLRNVGWCYTMKKAQGLGLFDDAEREDLAGKTYKEMTEILAGSGHSHSIDEDVAWFLGLDVHSPVIKKFKWLGLFDDEPLPAENNVMDMFSVLLQKKLSMSENDLDMIVLHHQFIIQKGKAHKYVTSTLVDMEKPGGDSSMSRTVSLPAAIATAMILEGKIEATGVHIPVTPEIYEPVLIELAEMGLNFIEKTETI